MEENSSGDVLDQGSPQLLMASSRTLMTKNKCDKSALARTDGIPTDDHHANGANGHSISARTRSEARTFSNSDQEIIRLVAQHLQDLGLSKSVDTLVTESGCQMEPLSASKFRQNVMNASWDEAEKSLKELMPLIAVPNGYKKMIFLLREQKYLENVQDGHFLEAIQILRHELTPLGYNTSRVHELSCGRQSLCAMAGWSGKGVASRQNLMDNLQAFLPPTVMLPPRRLRALLNQAVDHQAVQCQFHNLPPEQIIERTSFLVDHACSRDEFPAETSQILSDHCDEVWFCQFSGSGKKLATGSKDCTIIIWDVDLTTGKVTQNRILEGHGYAVAFLVWSPDEVYIAACGVDDNSDEMWVYTVESGELKCKVNIYSEDSLTTCAWHKDSKTFVAGGTKGQFYLCDLDGKSLETWEGVRVVSLAFRNDGKGVLASDTHHRVRLYDFDDVTDRHLIEEDKAIMYFSCDRSGRFALLNVASQGVHLWDLEDRVLVRKFQGLTQGYTTINSCFGGVDEKFIASGSEDHKVYIWNIAKENPILLLSGHTRSVNCVHWNPACPKMLASASDDGTVRIWMPKNSGIDSSLTANGTL